MRIPKLLWLATRTMALAGVSWMYSASTPPVAAFCANACSVKADSQGHIYSVSCINEAGAGKAEICSVLEGGCLFSGSACSS